MSHDAMPAAGGRYVRQPDGSLAREGEPTAPAEIHDIPPAEAPDPTPEAPEKGRSKRRSKER